MTPLKPKIILQVLLFVVATISRSDYVSAQVGEQSYFVTSKASVLSTSSDFRSSIYSIGLKTELKQEPFIKLIFDPSYSTGEAAGSTFSFQSFGFGLENVDGTRRIHSKLTYDKRDIENESSSANLFFDVGAEWTFSKSNLSFEGGRRSFAQELQSLVSVRDNLTGGYYTLKYNFSFADRWQIRALNKSYFISDSNTRTDSDLGLMYGISPSWPWIWLGFGAEYLTNSVANTTGYWAPRQFVNIGPRLDLAFPLFANFSFAGGFNFNKYNDIDFGNGTGYYAVAKIVYGSNDALKIEAGLESISSEQNSNRWTSSMVFLGAACPF